MSSPVQNRSILRYADDLRRWQWPPNERPVSDIETAPTVDSGPFKRAIRNAVPEPVISAGQVASTRIVMPLSARRLARAQRAGRELRIQFACGSNALPGWINLDLVGSSADTFWDLRRPLPLPDASVTAIYHEHFLEHLPFRAALGSLREAHRLLAPGGILRFGVPDFGRYAAGYVTGDGFLEQIKPDRPTACLAVNEILYWYGHRSMWDEETLVALLEELGFEDVGRRSFGDSALDPCPDWDLHESETLYVEARKR